MRQKFIICAIPILLILSGSIYAMKQELKNNKTIYDFTMKSIDGEDIPLSKYKGKVVLIVNVASKCGFTKQYKGLQKLYEKYSEKGFVILGFPANNFLHQEPGTDKDIKEFCSLNFGVKFPMFSKISVKGKKKHPLYKFLTGKNTNPGYSGKIRWNFEKFIFGRDGRTAARFHPKIKPLDNKILEVIENELKK